MGSAAGHNNLQPVILIVEDHDALRDSLKSWLNSIFPDCNILLAKNGKDALARSFEQPPDIVLMDVLLPGMNGIEITRRIKTAVPDAKIVMLSIYEDPAYQADAASAGSFAYIPKRKMGTELISLITMLLNELNADRLKTIEWENRNEKT